MWEGFPEGAAFKWRAGGCAQVRSGKVFEGAHVRLWRVPGTAEVRLLKGERGEPATAGLLLSGEGWASKRLFQERKATPPALRSVP